LALRTRNLVEVRPDDELVALRLLVDRRDELGRTRTQTVNRLHRLLLQLVPGGGEAIPVRGAGPGAAGERPPRLT